MGVVCVLRLWLRSSLCVEFLLIPFAGSFVSGPSWMEFLQACTARLVCRHPFRSKHSIFVEFSLQILNCRISCRQARK